MRCYTEELIGLTSVKVSGNHGNFHDLLLKDQRTQGATKGWHKLRMPSPLPSPKGAGRCCMLTVP